MELHRQAAQALAHRRGAICDAVTASHFKAYPELEARHGPAGREKCREDAQYHLSYLEQAVALASPELFADYVAWATTMLESRGVPEADLASHLRSLLDAVAAALPPEQGAAVEALAAPALARLPAAAPASLAQEGSAAHAFLAALQQGGARQALGVVSELMRGGLGLREMYVDVMQPALHEIGRLWQLNRISVAEEHYLTAAIQVVMAQLYPQLFAKPPSRPAVVIACVAGELHEIGARMVADVLQLAGFDSHFLGATTPVRDLVDFVAAKQAKVLGLSTTIAAHLSHVEATVRAVRADVRTRKVKIVVGGSPFARVPHLWRTVGADAVGSDAHKAVDLVLSLAA